MTKQRRSHEAKTEEERRRYVATMIEPTVSPTLDKGHRASDSTDAVAEEPENVGLAGIGRRRTQPSAVGRWFHEKGIELIVGVLIVGGLLWLARAVYSLNREVGELKERLHSVGTDQERLQKEIERLDERIARDLERRNSLGSTK